MKAIDDARFDITVNGVDGLTRATYTTDNIHAAAKFLEQQDHEGSSISMEVRLCGVDVYRLLSLIAELPKQPLLEVGREYALTVDGVLLGPLCPECRWACGQHSPACSQGRD